MSKPKSNPPRKRFGVPVLFIVEAATPTEARIEIEAALACADEESAGPWAAWGVIEQVESVPDGVHEVTVH